MKEDNLVIIADKFYTQLDLVGIGGVLILSLRQFIVHQDPAAGVVFAILALPFILDYIVNAKTIIMTENQVTVSFLWFSKTYHWKDIVVKRYYTDHHSLSRSVSSNGAEFCSTQIRRPIWMSTSFYAIFHPLSYFFVSFPSRYYIRQSGTTPYPYEVNELQFREKIKKWNIYMDEISESYF